MPVEAFLVVAFLGVTLLVPTAVGLIERLVRRAMLAVYGMPGRLGSLNIQRNRGRAALTASVMTIGAAMTIAMGGAEISFKGELERWINETLTSDFVISSSFSWLNTSYPTLPAGCRPAHRRDRGRGRRDGRAMDVRHRDRRDHARWLSRPAQRGAVPRD